MRTNHPTLIVPESGSANHLLFKPLLASMIFSPERTFPEHFPWLAVFLYLFHKNPFRIYVLCFLGAVRKKHAALTNDLAPVLLRLPWKCQVLLPMSGEHVFIFLVSVSGLHLCTFIETNLTNICQTHTQPNCCPTRSRNVLLHVGWYIKEGPLTLKRASEAATHQPRRRQPDQFHICEHQCEP